MTGPFDERFRSASASASLYCFPFAGGSASYYGSWSAHFGDPVELVPVQLPGRGPRMADPHPASIGELAAELAGHIAAAPTRPLLFGHSMGAILAFEVARSLRERLCPAEYLFVSGRPAPTITQPRTSISTLPRAELVEVLRRYGAAPQEVLAHDELLDVLLPMLRRDFAMIESYRYAPGQPLDCPVFAWCGTEDPDVTPGLMAGWARESAGAFDLRVRGGGHFFLTAHVAEIAATIRQIVAVSA